MSKISTTDVAGGSLTPDTTLTERRWHEIQLGMPVSVIATFPRVHLDCFCFEPSVLFFVSDRAMCAIFHANWAMTLGRIITVPFGADYAILKLAVKYNFSVWSNLV